MKIFEIVERFDLIYKLIKEERTGTASEFAKKLNISRSQLFNYLDHIKLYGLEVHYDSFKNSYVKTNDIEIEIRQPIKVLSKNELVSTEGGNRYISFF